jgi:hypothetical protein
MPSSSALRPWGGHSRLNVSFHVVNHLVGALERAKGAPGFHVDQALGEPALSS